MCMTCSVELNRAKADAFAAELLGTFNHAATTLMVSLGHRTGLFDIMNGMKPSTSMEIADQSGLNERYVRAWLGAMAMAKIVEYSPENETFRLPEEHALWLCRQNPRDNMAVFAQYIPLLGGVEDRILDAFNQGGGVPYAAYNRFHEVMAEDSGQSIVPAIVEQIIPLMNGMHEKLLEGADVLDIGCGSGLALMQMAKNYPNSRFRGVDIEPKAIERARMAAQKAHLTNLTFEVGDATHLDAMEQYDLITAFDAIHDQPYPDQVLKAIHKALKPGGLLLMQDIDLSSHLDQNLSHPMSTLLYTISCLHCMPVSLAQGGMGLGATWGRETAEHFLRNAGFENIMLHRFSHDIQNCYFISRK